MEATKVQCPTYITRRLTIVDKSYGLNFLVDTGVDISIIPVSAVSCKPIPSSFTLTAANGSLIKIYGQRTLRLNLGLRHDFPWVFVIADVQDSIIGADFLTHFNLLVDLRQQRLINANTQLSTKGHSIVLSSIYPITDFKSGDSTSHVLLHQFPDLTKPNFHDPKPKHSVVHHIHTRGPPVFTRPRRLAPERLQLAEDKFQHTPQLGII
ncbi:hypothetical protein T265_11383 [Opisthorchis viverrini]|uniref:Peptidase A2 domain-containing protein n=1 Tax=Opisthorchis viverrini TaxID=6198 RepID=A0A074Z366_OPIVI|nr:hypothetical protein T265_11383 [Opisthorchis viverrini]KER19967.1 hypothetical protein T265_11383 [Opisthorchis viverrini]